MATYKDIQRETGLSLATISKYYNGLPVRPENSAAIEAAASALGYRMNVLASNLRSGQTRTVGVTLPSLANQFHQSIIAGVERELRDEGISLIVTSSESGTPSDAIEFLLGRRVDGIIAVPTPAVIAGLEEAAAHGVPVVTIDWSPGELRADSVQLDNFAAGRVVAQHLVDHGHRRLGVIAGDDTVSSVHDRALGFREMLEVRGARPTDVVYGTLTVESGYEATMALLQLVDRPTGIFAVNYELSMGALIAVNESGLRLGRDISLVGFDAADLAR
ncbi:MAG TPA: LacI family DNA-binding transcriptional regulator, partial [Nocardioidaceae bacterium]|nr:LacI family DNA-binding transcriptional regulator [Nocardioidaceae bacterium]